jgi:hypothetical protein
VITAPFPWFGGKSRAADLIWSRFGSDVKNYVEPFAGSAAVALNRPKAFNGAIRLNDLDGNIANFWRAIVFAPDEVAFHACAPVNECDLHARHLWLVNNLPKLAPRLMADPDYCEPKTAGWWAWGCCAAIDGNWCTGGPWSAAHDEDGVPAFQRVKGNPGVVKGLPHLSDKGKGVNRKIQAPSTDARQDRLDFLTSWMQDLSSLLHNSIVTCGSYDRLLSIGTLTKLGRCAVLLDPPYSLTDAVYAHDSSTVSGEVRQWCKQNGGNPRLRIALCGHTGEGHEELEELGWTVETWHKRNGYRHVADDRERIWFSPHCLNPQSLF